LRSLAILVFESNREPEVHNAIYTRQIHTRFYFFKLQVARRSVKVENYFVKPQVSAKQSISEPLSLPSDPCELSTTTGEL